MKPPLRDYDALELAVVALFFIGGSILALALAIVYIGHLVLSFLGAHWNWVWETWV